MQSSFRDFHSDLNKPAPLSPHLYDSTAQMAVLSVGFFLSVLLNITIYRNLAWIWPGKSQNEKVKSPQKVSIQSLLLFAKIQCWDRLVTRNRARVTMIFFFFFHNSSCWPTLLLQPMTDPEVSHNVRTQTLHAVGTACLPGADQQEKCNWHFISSVGNEALHSNSFSHCFTVPCWHKHQLLQSVQRPVCALRIPHVTNTDTDFLSLH